MAANEPVLICFDGSEGSAHAIEEAGKLFPGAPAVVVHVWHRPALYGSVGYAGQPVIPPDVEEEIEQAAGNQANDVVKQGEDIARAAGLHVEGFAHVTPGPAWRQLLASADEVDARAIVVGSRGFGEMKALVLGSTSQALAHHSRRPLVIVPFRDHGV